MTGPSSRYTADSLKFSHMVMTSLQGMNEKVQGLLMLSFRSGMLSPPPIPLAEATHSLLSDSRVDERDFPFQWVEPQSHLANDGEPGRCEHLWPLLNVSYHSSY